MHAEWGSVKLGKIFFRKLEIFLIGREEEGERGCKENDDAC
jgi:hypothetical protein